MSKKDVKIVIKEEKPAKKLTKDELKQIKGGGSSCSKKEAAY
jgi:bacteriocin-like protein